MKQDNNLLTDGCDCQHYQTLQNVLRQLEELSHVMDIECTPAALDRLKFIITKNGGSLENGKI